jgi:hypothetical protein
LIFCSNESENLPICGDCQNYPVGGQRNQAGTGNRNRQPRW